MVVQADTVYNLRERQLSSVRVAISSLLVGVLGTVASRVGLDALAARAIDRDPHVYWALGLAASVPAWLIVFWSLLAPSPKPRPELVSAVSWIVSTADGLIGKVLSEGRVRRMGESG